MAGKAGRHKTKKVVHVRHSKPRHTMRILDEKKDKEREEATDTWMWHNFTEDFQRNNNRADRHKYRQNRTYYDIDTVVPNIQPIHTCQYTSLLITRCSGWLI